ncbi:hypothetical protein [Roseibium sediminicola]|uniref:Peptidase S8/S53 domain-containing protein n=1 Tax=Roseibium sediminicola TaxID=2933272 RepID=A0ABT0H1E0_9HYPH|nr:hypothetical protein [Roseibium sp. CAU 1639]MCK7615503.1 hypothetical protein [Roseibium sp. CAU 1639]
MIRTGLIDGALPKDWPGLEHQAWFCESDSTPHAGMHAAAMAKTIQSHAPDIKLVNAVVFPGRLAAAHIQVCAALDWFCKDPPDILLCAFGMARSSVELGLAVARLQRAGSILIASAPARGGLVYPAGLYGVLSVQGDARCGPQELSRLDLPQAVFGACPEAVGFSEIRGASPAAAHAAGLLAACQVETGRGARCLEGAVRYRGRERRGEVVG